MERRLIASGKEVIPVRLALGLSSLPVIRNSRKAILIAAALVGSPPILAVLAELIAGRTVSWFILVTATVYGALIAVMILGAVLAWQQVVRLAPDLDSMLEEADQQALVEWLSRALKWWPQILFLVCGVLASTLVGIKLSGPLGSHADHGGLAYSVTIGWTGGIGALSVYWLWGAPALFYPLSKIERPKLDWVEPLQTAAVQKASRLTASTSRLSSLGLLLFTIPIAGTVVLASREVSVWILSVSPAIFAAITVLASSVVPQIVLQDLLRKGREQTLAEIRALLPAPTEVFGTLQPEQLQAVELYRAIAAPPFQPSTGSASSSTSYCYWAQLFQSRSP